MSFHYPSCEIPGIKREDSFCHSALNNARSPELFDQEIDNIEDVSEFVPSRQIGAIFSGPHDTNLAISTNISDPSPFASSPTDSSYSSQYSFSVSEFETHGSVNSGLYHSVQAYISSAEFATGNHLPCIPPPLVPANSHGTMDLKPIFLAGDSMQRLDPLTCVNPAALSVHVVSDSETQAPVKKPFKCPQCPFCKSTASGKASFDTSARKHNLKTHIETHDKEASKKFPCSTCGRRFSRRHDLRRHRETIHGDRMLSPANASSRSLDSRLDRRPSCITAVSGDERLTTSLQPGSFSASATGDKDHEDLVDCWEDATWLQGA